MFEKLNLYFYFLLGLTKNKCQTLIEASSIEEKIFAGLNIGLLYSLLSPLLRRLKEYYEFEGMVYGNQNIYEFLNKEQVSFEHRIGILAENLQLEVHKNSKQILFSVEVVLFEQLIHTIKTSALLENNNYKPISLNFDKISKQYLHSSLFPRSTSELIPSRPKELSQSQFKSFKSMSNKDLVHDSEDFKAFLHYVLLDVEITATEICSINILQNASMPLDFILDMMRQSWDESRHSKFVLDHYFSLGGRLDDFPYTNFVLERFNTASNLAEAIAIQQLLQEGNAVEVNIHLIKELQNAGQYELAKEFEIVNNDEGLHVQIGNRWLKYLLKEDYETQFIEVLKVAAEKTNLPIYGKGAWNEFIRKQTGFPLNFIQSRTV